VEGSGLGEGLTKRDEVAELRRLEVEEGEAAGAPVAPGPRAWSGTMRQTTERLVDATGGRGSASRHGGARR
jgi:hypothetical protein